MLVLEIAAGIVLGFVVLRFLPVVLLGATLATVLALVALAIVVVAVFAGAHLGEIAIAIAWITATLAVLGVIGSSMAHVYRAYPERWPGRLVGFVLGDKTPFQKELLHTAGLKNLSGAFSLGFITLIASLLWIPLVVLPVTVVVLLLLK